MLVVSEIKVGGKDLKSKIGIKIGEDCQEVKDRTIQFQGETEPYDPSGIRFLINLVRDTCILEAF